MSAKKLQGADGLNFEMKLTMALLGNHNFPKESDWNEKGNEIISVEVQSGKLLVYVNLSHAVHPTNVYSFQLSDCIGIDNIRIRVLDFVKQYLKIY